MPTLQARGIELAWSEHGTGAAVLLLHETATSAAVWAGVVDALEGVRTLALDRRGWGRSTAPEGYLRSTVQEHSEDAAAVLESSGVAPAVIGGAGIGAVIALDLALRQPALVSGAVLVEPTMLGLLPAATEALSDDRRELERAVAEGGLSAVVELYLSGELRALGPGAERLPDRLTAAARAAPRSLVAELGATTTWSMPVARLGEAVAPCSILVSEGAPKLLREASAALAARLPEAELRRVEGAGPAHLGSPELVAASVTELVGQLAP